MTAAEPMHLRVLTPTRVVVDTRTARVRAEGGEGSFTLLPRHVDMVSALVPGLLVYSRDDGTEELLAVNAGTLVKCGRSVQVATTDAISDGDAATLQDRLEEAFVDLDEREQRSRAALARLESDITAQLIELDHD